MAEHFEYSAAPDPGEPDSRDASILPADLQITTEIPVLSPATDDILVQSTTTDIPIHERAPVTPLDVPDQSTPVLSPANDDILVQSTATEIPIIERASMTPPDSPTIAVDDPYLWFCDCETKMIQITSVLQTHIGI